jgi:hypothetical protein
VVAETAPLDADSLMARVRERNRLCDAAIVDDDQLRICALRSGHRDSHSDGEKSWSRYEED